MSHDRKDGSNMITKRKLDKLNDYSQTESFSCCAV